MDYNYASKEQVSEEICDYPHAKVYNSLARVTLGAFPDEHLLQTMDRVISLIVDRSVLGEEEGKLYFELPGFFKSSPSQPLSQQFSDRLEDITQEDFVLLFKGLQEQYAKLHHKGWKGMLQDLSSWTEREYKKELSSV